ncbi:MAG TPA: acetyl-CoA carboxylase biotin carboxyl carrier protein [Acidobacteriota bacterium]|nr:acetyl-CoA carboxylase biotin carboxyl carrier protein [Acidobacteriota bacterium]
MNKVIKPPETAGEGATGSKIDYPEILKLIALLEEKDLTLFELEVEGFKIKIGRNVPGAPAYHHAAPAPASAAAAGAFVAPEPVPGPGADKDIRDVTSPMVGTFYRASAPNTDPFVEIGEPVKKGQTLCIIEAMKLMNEIESDADGVVTAIHVENGKPVEYGQKLFSVRTSV